MLGFEHGYHYSFKVFCRTDNFKSDLALTSDSFDQEMGVPQGSILSVILFALKIICNLYKER